LLEVDEHRDCVATVFRITACTVASLALSRRKLNFQDNRTFPGKIFYQSWSKFEEMIKGGMPSKAFKAALRQKGDMEEGEIRKKISRQSEKR
jgi:hypothetical protein